MYCGYLLNVFFVTFKILGSWEFPGGSMLGTLSFQCKGYGFNLVEELRSHTLEGQKEKKKNSEIQGA